MTIDERREYLDSLGYDSPDTDLVEAHDSKGEEAPAADPMTPAAADTIMVPDAGKATATLPPVNEGRSQSKAVAVRAGGAEVTLQGANGGRAARGPVEVVHLAGATAERLGAVGGVFTLEPAATPETRVGPGSKGDATSSVSDAVGGQVEVAVDVSHLAAAGGDLVHRLGLKEVPPCALRANSSGECGPAVPVRDARLDLESMTLTATVTLPESRGGVTNGSADFSGGTSAEATEPMISAPADPLVLAVTADSSGGAGDWGATSLASSASWDVSTQTGAFSWSYPMRTPPVPGQLGPDLSLSYSSGSLDGRVASSNNQSSQVGDGWEANLSGYIERKFVPCSEDQSAVGGEAANNANHDTGDLCWRTDNATMMLGGKAVELVRDGNTSTWRPESDDNTKIEHRTDGWNTDNNKEYWVATTDDGTQYWFGRDRRAASDTRLQSALVTPVYGNHPEEQCYQPKFADSQCLQVWRWMLDYVVDTSGNSMTYFYSRSNNRYGYDNNAGTVSYNRTAQLDRIEYGTRDGDTTTQAPARVMFDYEERCTPTSTFDCAADKLTAANSARWPDVPFDLICTSTTSCPEVTAPVFFDRRMLTEVTTQVLNGSTYNDTDHWKLGQTFPNPGDGSSATAWLASITHTGRGGVTNAADIPLPAVQFHGVQLDNRVERIDEWGPAMTRWRIDKITSESGGITTVNYSDPQCAPGSLPSSPQDNEMRCRPVYWTPTGYTEPQREYFHHYRVTSVEQDARLAGTAAMVTTYNYDGGPAWHYDDNELVKPKQRTWSQLRGYAAVEEYTGIAGVPSAPRLHTGYRYFRGMHGDRYVRSDGTVTTRDKQVDGINDVDQYAGMLREKIDYNGSEVVTRERSAPWRSAATATDPADSSKKAYHTAVEVAETVQTTSSGSRTARTTTEFDSYGMPTKVADTGDVAVAGDERCTSTTYTRNTTKNVLSTVERVETVDVGCGQTPSRPADVMSDQRWGYDGQAVGVAPTTGRVTLTQEAGSYSGGSPNYVDTSATTYNNLGQVTSTTDAEGAKTTTSYLNTGGLTLVATTTSPDPDGTGPLTAHATATKFSTGWGVPIKVTDPNGKVTSGAYDGLGRLTQVWEPGRVEGTHTPTTKYSYFVRETGMNAVVTETLNWDATEYVVSSAIYDGLLRQRQAQLPSQSAKVVGRVVNESFYDSRGLAVVSRDGWATSGIASSSLLTTTKAVDSRTEKLFDGAARSVRETFQVGDGEKPDDGTSYLDKWTTTTTYEGDRTHVNPPVGGTPTTTLTDVRGRTTQLWQYEGASPSGTHHVTSYRYDGADRLVGVTDPARNEWSYTYDLRGRQTGASDPDKGDSATEYDDAGRVTLTTDARDEKLAYTYDALGRKTSMRDDNATGAVRARWTYDLLASGTVVKGQLATSTRVQDGAEYTTRVNGYTDQYLPTTRTIKIPDTEELGDLSGEYTSEYTYTKDGRMWFERVPAAGGLASEGLTTFYSDTNVADGLTGGGGVGDYVTRADYLPTGEVSYLSTGNTYAYQRSLVYGTGTRRLENVTTTQQISAQGDLRELQHASYEYDDAGNVLSVKDVPTAESGQPSDQQCFEYDWARRLADAWTPESGDCGAAPSVEALGGAEPYWTSYTYDVLGNRLSTMQHLPSSAGGVAGSGEIEGSSSAVAVEGAVTSSYVRPTSGPTSTRPHSVTSVAAVDGSGANLGTSEYTYDAAGNMTGRNLAGAADQSLSWDAEGELASVAQDENGDGSVSASESDEFVYSAEGDRLVRKQDGDVTVYLPGQEITLDGETGAVSAQRYYSFAGQSVALRSGPMAAGVTSIFADPHGTGTIQIANTVDRVVRRYTDGFGSERGSSAGVAVGGGSSTSEWVGDHGFLDKPEDSSGLTAVGARLYDSMLGAFVSVDPIMDLSDPQQWNAYGYANQNPTTWSDPTGLKPMGAGHEGYDPRTQPNGGDPCAKAMSCIKKKGGSAPVKVRECYTAYACGFFSSHADGYTTSGGGTVGLVSYAGGSVGTSVNQTGAAALAQAAARAAEMARIKEKNANRERLTEAADQKGMWQKVNGWASAESGYNGWSGQKVSETLGDASVIIGWGTAGTCFVTKWCAAHPVTAAVAGGLLGISALAGGVATAIDCAGDLRSAGCVIGTLGVAAGSMGFAARTAGRLDPVTVEGFDFVGDVWSKTMDVVGILEKASNG
ncbi:RHS repeat-associated core domain-containing protein [Promicromonospora kroppenstedtii]|uniref:RHS repeat-associated core domain-containing protein n=1 Tax=Promicromonospora kroppenstedtii TaxID=440482 RepID=UPI00146F9657|nr:RHS repeat-associated core domain-containing protein [Promicromonospora kroppenstedtii]